MSHPTDDGDTGLALGFEPAAIEEALPLTDRIRVTRLDLRMRYGVGLLMAAIDRHDDALAIDELAIGVLRGLDERIDGGCVSSAEARRVRCVRERLAETPDRRWTLAELGAVVGWSPYHLAHQFRAHTGTTVHRYLTDLRVAAALRRIENGDKSLATVAADLGFAHHSHLTATLRRRLGLTPRMIRERLRGQN